MTGAVVCCGGAAAAVRTRARLEPQNSAQAQAERCVACPSIAAWHSPSTRLHRSLRHYSCRRHASITAHHSSRPSCPPPASGATLVAMPLTQSTAAHGHAFTTAYRSPSPCHSHSLSQFIGTKGHASPWAAHRLERQVLEGGGVGVKVEAGDGARLTLHADCKGADGGKQWGKVSDICVRGDRREGSSS